MKVFGIVLIVLGSLAYYRNGFNAGSVIFVILGIFLIVKANRNKVEKEETDKEGK
ncbi:MAG: hypothetical protein H6Q16_2119 [Bacteroidetes bacterium]|nr:hypothetical protein [Bacteroidota bacterium]